MKRNNTFIYIYLIFFALSYSCSNKESVLTFPLSTSISGVKYDVPDLLIGLPSSIVNVGNSFQITNSPIETVSLPDHGDENKQQIILFAIKLKNKHLLMYGLFDNRYMFQITDSTNTVKSRFGEYDFDEQDKNPMINKCLAYQGMFHVRDSVLVWACHNAQIIEAYNIGNVEDVQRIQRIKLRAPLYKPQNTGTGHASGYLKENKTGYIDMALTDDRVYLLYSDRKFKIDDHTYNQRSKEIQVFDLNLNAIEKVMLDKEVSRITLSPDKSIYAIQYMPEPIVLSFYLPNSKLKI